MSHCHIRATASQQHTPTNLCSSALLRRLSRNCITTRKQPCRGCRRRSSSTNPLPAHRGLHRRDCMRSRILCKHSHEQQQWAPCHAAIATRSQPMLVAGRLTIATSALQGAHRYSHVPMCYSYSPTGHQTGYLSLRRHYGELLRSGPYSYSITPRRGSPPRPISGANPQLPDQQCDVW